MDQPQPEPPPNARAEGRSLLLGILLTIFAFLAVVALLTLIMLKSGKGNYYERVMENAPGASSGR